MNFKLLIIISAVLFLTSCSHRMVGVWSVQRYETITPGKQNIILNNIGTMEFKKDGTGEKHLNYSIMGTTKNVQVPFKWDWNNDEYISIESQDNDFSKTWIIVENKKKFQKWKSTDGTNGIQILELKK